MVFVETKTEVITRIAALAERLAARFTEEDADEQAHIRKLCSPEARQALETMSVPALHLLDVIPSSSEDASSMNVVGLSQATGVPKGTVSKRVQRLTDAGIVSRHRIPGNRKEVHLQLTSLGEEIRAAHRSLHEQMGTVFDDFLARYSQSDLEVVGRVLDDLLRMPREGLRFRPDLLE